VMPCSVVTGYQRFRDPCYVYFQSEVTGDVRVWVILLPTVSQSSWLRTHMWISWP